MRVVVSVRLPKMIRGNADRSGLPGGRSSRTKTGLERSSCTSGSETRHGGIRQPGYSTKNSPKAPDGFINSWPIGPHPAAEFISKMLDAAVETVVDSNSPDRRPLQFLRP